MIKINLLPQKELKRKRRSVGGRGAGGGPGAGQTIAALFMLVLVMEVAGLMYWYMETDEIVQQSGDLGPLNREKSKLETVKAELAELHTLETEVGKQRLVFDELQDNKTGPVNMLLFLSYVLRPVDSSMNEDEYAVLSELWRPERPTVGGTGGSEDEWNPDRIWLMGISELNGSLKITGRAKDHEDVMVFMRRLKSGIYFEGLDLAKQAVGRPPSPLGQSYVKFTLTAEANYNPNEYPPL